MPADQIPADMERTVVHELVHLELSVLSANRQQKRGRTGGEPDDRSPSRSRSGRQLRGAPGRRSGSAKDQARRARWRRGEVEVAARALRYNLLSSPMLKLGTLRWKGRCARHPRYDPAFDGEGGVRGGCTRCLRLLEIHEQHERLVTMMRISARCASGRSNPRTRRKAASGDCSISSPPRRRSEVPQAWPSSR